MCKIYPPANMYASYDIAGDVPTKSASIIHRWPGGLRFRVESVHKMMCCRFVFTSAETIVERSVWYNVVGLWMIWQVSLSGSLVLGLGIPRCKLVIVSTVGKCQWHAKMYSHLKKRLSVRSQQDSRDCADCTHTVCTSVCVSRHVVGECRSYK